MSTEKMKIPKLRFPGFTDAWEQRKLGDITSKIGSGKTPLGGKEAYVEDGICLIRSQNVHDDKVDLTDVVYIDKETDDSMSNSRVINGDVLLNITGASIGRSAVYTGVDSANVNQHVCIIRPVEGYESKYIQLNISSANGQKQIESSQAGGGREGLNFQQIGKMTFMFPKSEEQQRIGECFSNLDSLITFHQHKIDQMKEYKQGMLQKMFPKEGESVPEIRFPGFTDDWEQRKFSDLAQRESTFCASSFGLPGVEYEDVVAGEGRLNKDIRLKEVQKTGIVFDGTQVLYGKLRPYLHNWLSPDFQGVAIGDWWVLRPIGIDKNFLFRLIQTKQFDEVANQSSGSKMPRADWNLVSNTEFIIPSSLDEQKQIASTFDDLDTLITLHQRKFDQMKEFKKGMLQQMFV